MTHYLRRIYLFLLLATFNSEGVLLSQDLSRQFYGSTDSFDEPQPSDRERFESFVANGKYSEEIGLDTVAIRRRPEHGYPVGRGLFIRVAINNNSFEMGYPPRLFLYVENWSGETYRMDKHRKPLEFVKLVLSKENKIIPPNYFYDYCQMLASRQLWARSPKLVPGNYELVFSTRIEDAFGILDPGSYKLEVQVNPNGMFYDLPIENSPPSQSFLFKVLSDQHKYGTNGLFSVYTQEKKEAQRWFNQKTLENFAAGQPDSTVQSPEPIIRVVTPIHSERTKSNNIPAAGISSRPQNGDASETPSTPLNRSRSMMTFLVGMGLLMAIAGLFAVRRR